jgi:ribosomal protein L19
MQKEIPSDTTKVNVTVVQQEKENINPFNTVLLSKITTNGETATSQETKGINEIQNLDKRIAIMEQICKRNNIK